MASAPNGVSSSFLNTEDLVRARTDKNAYRLITLENGLEVLLVTSDSNSENVESIGENEDANDANSQDNSTSPSKAGSLASEEQESEEDSRRDEDDPDSRRGFGACAVAMAVGVGSFHELANSEPHGLAHLLEHMLFMGSEKYPSENAYDDHLHKFGGFSNAYTEAECTVYYFEVAQPGLRQALDIFAQFFISPLMLKDSLEREINAVDSEFDTVRADDELRMKAVWRMGALPRHPYARFCWGNSSSLNQEGVDLRTKLRDFYLRHYRVEKMKLVVWSVDDPDSLEQIVRESYQAIPAKPLGALEDLSSSSSALESQYGLPFLAETALGNIHRIIPVHDGHTLRLTWQYEARRDYKSCEADYVGHLVGHESEGGILSYLKMAGWATDLWAGISDDDGHESSTMCRLFGIELKLTEDGVQHWEDCMSAILAYLGMLQREGPQLWIFDELKNIAQASFDFKDEGEPINEVGDLAVDLLPKSAIPDRRHLLCAGHLLFEFDAEDIMSLIKALGCEGANAPRIDIVSSTFGRESNVTDESAQSLPIPGTYHKEEYWGTRFWREPLSDRQLQRMRSCRSTGADGTVAFSLPPRNMYIPERLEVHPLEAKRLKEDAQHAVHPIVGATVEIRLPNGKSKHTWLSAKCTSARMRDDGLGPRASTSNDEQPTAIELRLDFDSVLEEPMWLEALGPESQPSLTRHILEFSNASHERLPIRITVPTLPPRPELLAASTKSARMFWLQDSVARVPRAALFICIRCPELMHSPRKRAIAELVAGLCMHELDHETYLAKMAGLDINVKVHDEGFVCSILGFSEKLLELLKRALPSLLKFIRLEFDLSAQVDRIQLEQENLVRQLKNAENETDIQANNARLRAIVPGTFAKQQIAAELEGKSPAALFESLSRLDEGGTVDALMHGNVTRKDAEAALGVLRSVFEKKKRGQIIQSSPSASSKRARVVSMVSGTLSAIVSLSWEPSEKTSALQLYYQLGEDTLANQALGEALETLMDEPLFNELRTKQQLGYVVSCGLRRTHGMLGFAVELTSSKYAPYNCLERFDRFLSEFRREELGGMSDPELRMRLESLSRRILQKDAGLFVETKRHWHPIFEQTFRFNEKWLVVHELLHQPRPGNRFGVSVKDVQRFFDARLSPANRRALLVITVGGQSCSTVIDERAKLIERGAAVLDSVEDFWAAHPFSDADAPVKAHSASGAARKRKQGR